MTQPAALQDGEWGIDPTLSDNGDGTFSGVIRFAPDSPAFGATSVWWAEFAGTPKATINLGVSGSGFHRWRMSALTDPFKIEPGQTSPHFGVYYATAADSDMSDRSETDLTYSLPPAEPEEPEEPEEPPEEEPEIGFVASIDTARIRSLRILCRMTFPNETVRLWEGSGPYIDASGDLWRCCVLAEGALDTIETAINAEAWTMSLGLSGIDRAIVDMAWQDHQDNQVIGSKVEILIQDCDENDQPVGDPDVRFTGYIDDIEFDDYVNGDVAVGSVTVQVRNRFVLRSAKNGGVLSDVTQRARSAILNPSEPADRFCERIPGLAEKTIRWPTWN